MKSPIIPKKSLGQNFLGDPDIIRNIVNSLEVPASTSVVEIGPGTGALTGHLVQRFSDFTAIEIDERAIGVLNKQFPDLDVLHCDVLDARWISKIAEDRKTAVIGNLPYYITSPILFLLIDNRSRFEQAVLMVQKEVAERIVAKPGGKAYGILSVQTQLAAQVEYLFTVPRTAFHPVPNVDSAVIRLTFNQPEPAAEPDFLRRVIRQAFSQRRKMLRNTLSPLLQGKTLDGWDLTRRAETLSIEEYVQLTNDIRTLTA